MPFKGGAGDLYHTVAFEQRTITTDGYGNTETSDFEERFRCRAGLSALRGGEAVMGSRLEGRQPVIVRVRRSRDTTRIAADWRARDVFSDQVYAVRAVSETTDRKWIEVVAESGVAA